MKTHKLENYLRSHRRRAGLTQREVAFLIGCRDGAQISRYEKRRRLPPLETALAWEIIFGIPVSELFAGMHEAIGDDVSVGLKELKLRLESSTTKTNAKSAVRKLNWINEQPLAAGRQATASTCKH